MVSFIERGDDGDVPSFIEEKNTWTYISPEEVAYSLGVSEQVVEQWVDRGNLPPPDLVTKAPPQALEKEWRWWDEDKITPLTAQRRGKQSWSPPQEEC